MVPWRFELPGVICITYVVVTLKIPLPLLPNALKVFQKLEIFENTNCEKFTYFSSRLTKLIPRAFYLFDIMDIDQIALALAKQIILKIAFTSLTYQNKVWQNVLKCNNFSFSIHL